MSRRLLAYSAYTVGSAVFLSVALSRGHVLLAVGSGLFLLGTLLLLAPTTGLLRSGAADTQDSLR